MPKCEWERHGGESVAKTAEFVCGGIDDGWERERELLVFSHIHIIGEPLFCAKTAKFV